MIKIPTILPSPAGQVNSTAGQQQMPPASQAHASAPAPKQNLCRRCGSEAGPKYSLVCISCNKFTTESFGLAVPIVGTISVLVALWYYRLEPSSQVSALGLAGMVVATFLLPSVAPNRVAVLQAASGIGICLPFGTLSSENLHSPGIWMAVSLALVTAITVITLLIEWYRSCQSLDWFENSGGFLLANLWRAFGLLLLGLSSIVVLLGVVVSVLGFAEVDNLGPDSALIRGRGVAVIMYFFVVIAVATPAAVRKGVPGLPTGTMGIGGILRNNLMLASGFFRNVATEIRKWLGDALVVFKEAIVGVVKKVIIRLILIALALFGMAELADIYLACGNGQILAYDPVETGTRIALALVLYVTSLPLAIANLLGLKVKDMFHFATRSLVIFTMLVYLASILAGAAWWAKLLLVLEQEVFLSWHVIVGIGIILMFTIAQSVEKNSGTVERNSGNGGA